MADLSVEVHTRIDAVDEEAWEFLRAACDAGVFADPRFLRAVECWLQPPSLVWHVLLRNTQREPVAAATLCTFPVDLFILAPARVRRALAALRARFPDVLRPITVFCGTPVSLGQSHLMIRQSADVETVARIIDGVMLDLARHTQASLLCHKEFQPGSEGCMRAFAALDFTPLASLPMHEFDAHSFVNWESYLQRLTAHYRYDITRSQRRAARRGLRVRRLSQPEAIVELYTDEVHQLYHAVVDNSDYQFERLTRAFFIELACAYGGGVGLTIAELDGRIVGFNWSLHTGSNYYLLFCGIDYALNRECDVYFNLMYAEMRSALGLGAQMIQFGQTADHFKARLGCHATARWVMIKSQSPLLNRVLHVSRPVLETRPPPTHKPAIYHAT